MHIYNMVNCLGLCTSVLFIIIIIIIIIIITTISYYCTELHILLHFLNLLLIITMIILIWVILKPGMVRTGMG